MPNRDAAWLFDALARAIRPRPKLGIAEWCEKNVTLGADSNSPRPGPLSFALTPYCLAPLARLDPADPARVVNVIASAQSGKSSIGQAWLAYSAVENPAHIGVYLPSLDDARKYAELKVQAIVDSSPPLRHRFARVSTRSNEGSSTLRKRFTGGSLLIMTASSPNSLQMVSFRDVILEEIAGFEVDVGGRGSPIAQSRKRQAAYETSGAKTLQVSAAGVQGSCPSTAQHDAGTAHELYAPCPHCDGFNRFEFEDMNAPSPALGLGAHFTCKLCGAAIAHHHKSAMMAAAIFCATYEDKDDKTNEAPPAAFAAEERAKWEGRDERGRQPSFRWWIYVSPFTTWDLVWAEGQAAKKAGLAEEKTFWQQSLARAWDEGRDAPDHVALFNLREEYDEGIVPAGAYLLTGGVDVQGDRLHWAVYAWAPAAEWWLVERDIIMGDPAGQDVWRDLTQVINRRWKHAEGGEIGAELFGVDAGYKSNHVYQFCARHPRARAMDGRPGWTVPYIGKPKRVVSKIDGRRVGATMLLPTGTWSLKSELQFSLKKMMEVPPGMRCGGRGHFHMGVDENYVRELVAETIKEEAARGKITRAWQVRPGFRNEEMDIWVIARALAFGLGVGAPQKEFDWEAARATMLAGAEDDLFAPNRIGNAAAADRDARSTDAAPAADAAALSPASSSGWKPKHTFTRANA